MKSISILLGFIILFPLMSLSQRNYQKYSEIFFGTGPTFFLGDLGGRDQVGTQNSPVDLNFKSTRIGGAFGYKYRFHRFWATSSQIYFGMVSGSDENTDEIARNSRNLSFRSPILEVSQRVEFFIVGSYKEKSKYDLGLKRRTDSDFNLFIFTGLSGFFFNPQTKINNKWTNLRPLKTEGQGLPGGVESYSPLSWGIPFGLGFKFGIGDGWKIGLEMSYTKTFTDYIDDVSTVYYDPEMLLDKVGPEAVQAANPAIDNADWFGPGMKRGNPDDNDAYFYANIMVTKELSNNYRRGKMKRARFY